MAEQKKETGLQKFNRAITNSKTQEYLESVLGERKASFVNNLTALVANNANLQACEPYTVMFAAMKATALDLPLDNSLGFAYVIPYKDNKKKHYCCPIPNRLQGICAAIIAHKSVCAYSPCN